MVTAQHYVWAAGHVILLLSAIRYLLAWVTFKSAGYSFYYSASYLGAIVSYAIVCAKAFGGGVTQPNAAFLRRAVVDENVQYLFLAVYWFISRPLAISLIPFATFSLFHTITFLRQNALPHLFPPVPPASAGEAPQQHPTLKTIQTWIRANYDSAMSVVAYAEVFIMIWVILGAITFQVSFVTPIVFAHFLRQRYHQSNPTAKAVLDVNNRLDGYVRRSNNPTVIMLWDKARSFIRAWSTSTVIPQQQPPTPTGQPRR